MIICISVVSVVISPILFIILFNWILSLLFLISLTKGLWILFIFFKNQVLVSLIFILLFWGRDPRFYIFPLWFLLFPSFCWLWTLFILVFLIPLDGRLSCLFEIFLLSQGRTVSLKTSLSESLLLYPIDFIYLFFFYYFLLLYTSFFFFNFILFLNFT